MKNCCVELTDSNGKVLFMIFLRFKETTLDIESDEKPEIIHDFVEYKEDKHKIDDFIFNENKKEEIFKNKSEKGGDVVFSDEGDIKESPKFVKADMVKNGVVVIDVGINRVEDATTKKGYRVVGDVDFEEVDQKIKK